MASAFAAAAFTLCMRSLNWDSQLTNIASVSGLAISSLQLINEKYRPYKGVRTLTRSGNFTVRTS
eukprot:10683-Heterococcus_DN1.PRE.2